MTLPFFTNIHHPDTSTAMSSGHLGHHTPTLPFLSTFSRPSVEQFVIEIQAHRWACHGLLLHVQLSVEPEPREESLRFDASASLRQLEQSPALRSENVPQLNDGNCRFYAWGPAPFCNAVTTCRFSQPKLVYN